MMACNSAQLILMLIGLVSAAKVVAVPLLQPLPSCPTSCGKLSSIPYPFGTSPDCYLDDDFLITCNHTFNPPKAFSQHVNMEVLDISLDGQMKVASSIAYQCYNSGRITDASEVQVASQTFSVSSTRNKFYVIGCDTYALIGGYRTKNYTTGCAAVCDKLESVENGSCSGIGCCQNSIPRGARDFNFEVFSFENHSRVLDFNPCGYAFVAEEGYFNFSSADLMDLPNRTKTNNHVPVVLDWSVGNLTCQESMQNQSSYACRAEYSQCQDSDNGGYVCSCLPGFEGNPYLMDGCKDIDECETSHPCSRICTNSLGNYSCSCPKGFEGDGKREGTGCQHKDKAAKQLYIAIGALLTVLLLLVGSFWIYRASMKRKLSKQREEFFQQNGGLLLQEKLSRSYPIERAIVFSEKDLNRATNNFSEGTVIGKGGFGTVHKGVLSDGREVAIKKSKVTDPSQNEQFINEVVVLSQISHRHVVKLLGCCLETKVPYLVYEFIKNGTLHKHIHDEHLSSKFTWDLRLKVAAETADALAYLHSAASIPIIHRDVKSTNILLDEDYNAKVADFGASKFIPLDKKEVTTLIQGTFGYLDPEYIHSSQLTDKSDVYSFGVVLAELVTGKPAVSFSKPESERNLAMYFVVSITEHKLLEILDHHLVVEGKVEQVKEIALLAKRCLNVKREERPTMKGVAMQLEGMKMGQHRPWIENGLNLQESDSLPHPAASAGSQAGLVGDSKGCNSILASYDSINKQIIESLNDGR